MLVNAQQGNNTTQKEYFVFIWKLIEHFFFILFLENIYLLFNLNTGKSK